MSQQTQLQAEFVEFIPERLEPGKLYISRRFSTATHLRCCGCGLKVVTPLNPAKWRLIESNGKVSLYPSIGNWSFPCQSHYWITESRVQWANAMSPQVIAAVKKRDRQDAELYAQTKGKSGTVLLRLVSIWAQVMKRLRQWFKL